MVLQGHLSRATGSVPAAEIRAWFRDTPGRELLAQEHALLEQQLPDLFGYYLVQLGFIGDVPEAVLATRIRQRVVVASDGPIAGDVVPVAALFAQLPICTDSVDAALLVHTLDFSGNPHGVLREVERILIPEGRVIVIGFNPLSLWGLRRFWPGRRKGVPWNARFIAVRRMHDWLRLFGFDIELTHRLMFRPPFRREGLMRKLTFVEGLGARFFQPLAGVYVIRAVKRVVRLTPIEPSWRSGRRLLSGRAVEPTTRAGAVD
jgi:SAM-dependent methyltransferase